MTAPSRPSTRQHTAKVAHRRAEAASPLEPAEHRVLAIRLPVDDLAKYAGVTALASAVLAIAGILATVAYLSAWNVPAPVVRLDPATAALRSDTVLFQFATLWGLLIGLTATWHRLSGRRRLRAVVIAVVLLVLAALSIALFTADAYGPTISLLGAAFLFVAHERPWLADRSLAIAFAIIALSSAWETGIENGTIIRDHREWQTPVSVSVRLPIAGLDGGIERAGGVVYDGLYLVFRDGESVYVSRPGAGASVWVIPSGNLMGLGILAR
jgi:hypothetical protein